jgi:DNA processing protein
MQGSVVDRVGLALACAGRPGSRRVLAEAGGAAALPPGWEEAARAEIDRATRMGAAILTPEDGGFPPLLRDAADPPPVLFARGVPAPDDRLAVAVVGARRATHWGANFAFRLARDLAAAGFTVVSGLARGIDAAAHRGALAGGGRTIALLGSGLDRVYPAEHRRLAETIAGRGLVMTELPFGTPPLARHFPERNRLIAGMAWATVVVEAARGSGSLITASLALDGGRLVFAVPGPPGEPNAEGTNALLRAGAHCCRGAQDVIEDLAPQITEAAARVAESRGAAGCAAAGRGATAGPDAPAGLDATAGLDAAARRVLGALSPARGADLGRLERATGLAPGPLLAALLELELRGLATQLPGQRFVAAEGRPGRPESRRI